jgi:hypothetical protein
VRMAGECNSIWVAAAMLELQPFAKHVRVNADLEAARCRWRQIKFR